MTVARGGWYVWADAGARAVREAPLTDLAEGKVTLPLSLTLKRCTVAERDAAIATLKELSGVAVRGEEPDRSAVAPVSDLVARYHGGELTIERARAHAARARSRIDPFADCEAKQALCDLADFVVSRKH